VEPASSTIIDWRKFSDGDKLCKQLKDIEKKEYDHAQQEDWRKELTNVLLPGAESTTLHKWEKYSYNDTPQDEFNKRYEDFISKANWNFNPTTAPMFANRPHMRQTKEHSSDSDTCVMEPGPLNPVELDGTAYPRAILPNILQS
jgi:hypothetical protein